MSYFKFYEFNKTNHNLFEKLKVDKDYIHDNYVKVKFISRSMIEIMSYVHATFIIPTVYFITSENDEDYCAIYLTKQQYDECGRSTYQTALTFNDEQRTLMINTNEQIYTYGCIIHLVSNSNLYNVDYNNTIVLFYDYVRDKDEMKSAYLKKKHIYAVDTHNELYPPFKKEFTSIIKRESCYNRIMKYFFG